jgi:hypothetical protein
MNPGIFGDPCYTPSCHRDGATGIPGPARAYCAGAEMTARYRCQRCRKLISRLACVPQQGSR